MNIQSISSSPTVRCSPIPLAVLVWFAAVTHSLALPEILVQPTDQTNFIGTTALFTVGATGAPPVTYQWRSYSSTASFTNILDATNHTLVLPDVQTAPYRFAVLVCDPSGCVTSVLVRLVILSPPRITNEPPDKTVCLSENYTNFPGIMGTAPFSYQWYFNGEPLAGKTARTLTLSNVQFTNAGDYQIIITNLYGAATSRLAHLTVVCCPLSITMQPVDRRIGEGDTYTNEVAAVGSRPISYQWCFKGEALSGKTNTVLSIPNLTPTHDGDYTVIVTNLCSAVTSRVARLTVVGGGVTFTKVTSGPVVTDLGYSVGAAWADYDGDGWVDLFVANNFWEATSAPNFLYHNLGQGVFERVTNQPFASDSGKYASAVWWDYDNDGRLDLFVGGYAGTPAGAVLHYRNEGNGAFSRVHDPVLEGARRLAAAGDYDNDGAVDLVASGGGTNYLLRNNGNGSFVQITTGPIATNRLNISQLKAWGDCDNDGDLDLVVGVWPDIQPALYTNQGNGTFARVTQGAIPTNTTASVTPTWGDCNNDGFLDLFFASATTASPSSLFYNDGHGDFTKVAFVTGGNHVYGAWADYDNDGWLDLFLPNTVGTCLLYHNNGDGTFTSIRSLVVTKESAYHVVAAWADYDNDGFLDLFVTDAASQPNFLYHNDGNSNHWLLVKLEGTVANRAAIGAKVRVRATIGGQQFWQLRQISADSFAQNDLRAHFGLGDATVAELVRIEWPSRQVTELRNVAANQTLSIKEPPMLKAAGWSHEGGFQMQVIGHANTVCDVMTSSTVADPASWTPMQCVTNTSRTNLVVDPVPPSGPGARFYKAVPR